MCGVVKPQRSRKKKKKLKLKTVITMMMMIIGEVEGRKEERGKGREEKNVRAIR